MDFSKIVLKKLKQNSTAIFNWEGMKLKKIQVMRELVFYLYSGRVPLLESMTRQLFPIADRFQLYQLKLMAEAVS